MPEPGRLIRVSTHRSDTEAVTYIVALADPAAAIKLIRAQASGPHDQIEDMGRVASAILEALNLGPGQFVRT
jgi:hypothetical protein